MVFVALSIHEAPVEVRRCTTTLFFLRSPGLLVFARNQVFPNAAQVETKVGDKAQNNEGNGVRRLRSRSFVTLCNICLRGARV